MSTRYSQPHSQSHSNSWKPVSKSKNLRIKYKQYGPTITRERVEQRENNSKPGLNVIYSISNAYFNKYPNQQNGHISKSSSSSGTRKSNNAASKSQVKGSKLYVLNKTLNPKI